MREDIGKNRYEFVDIAKGIGIILVILAHLMPSTNKLTIIIYSFHMPMFFFISGLFASSKVDKFGNYFVKQIKRLLIPFVAVFLIGLILTWIVPIWDMPSAKEVLYQFIYASPINIHVGPIWFLVALFNVSIMFYFYNKLVLSRNDMVLSLFSLGFIAFIAFYLPRIEDKLDVSLPFKLSISIMALVFYTIGYLSKNLVLSDNKTKNRNKIFDFLLCMGCLAVLIVIPVFINGMTYLSAGIYGTGLFSYIFPAMCGTLIVINVSRSISRNSFLEYVGKNSLVIFSVHSILTSLYGYFVSGKIDNVYIEFLINIFATAVILFIMVGISLMFNKIKKKIIALKTN